MLRVQLRKAFYATSPGYKMVVPRIKVQMKDIKVNKLQLDDISGAQLPDIFVKYSSVQDLDPSTIDTRAPVMYKMWSKDLLVEYCKLNGLKSAGNKTVLIERIREFWGILDGKNFCEKELKLSRAEIFLVFGKDRRTLKAISGASNAKISLDDSTGRLKIRAELPAVLKAERMIWDLTKNVRTQSVSASDIPSGFDKDKLAIFIRQKVGAYAGFDPTLNLFMMAAENSILLSNAVSILCSINDIYSPSATGDKGQKLFIQCDREGIEKSHLSFFPCQDLSWPLFYRTVNAYRLLRFNFGDSPPRYQDGHLSFANLGNNGALSDDLVTIPGPNHEADHVEVSATFGHVVCTESPLSDNNLSATATIPRVGFPFDDYVYENNVLFNNFVKWFSDGGGGGEALGSKFHFVSSAVSPAGVADDIDAADFRKETHITYRNEDGQLLKVAYDSKLIDDGGGERRDKNELLYIRKVSDRSASSALIMNIEGQKDCRVEVTATSDLDPADFSNLQKFFRGHMRNNNNNNNNSMMTSTLRYFDYGGKKWKSTRTEHLHIYSINNSADSSMTYTSAKVQNHYNFGESVPINMSWISINGSPSQFDPVTSKAKITDLLTVCRKINLFG